VRRGAAALAAVAVLGSAAVGAAAAVSQTVSQTVSDPVSQTVCGTVSQTGSETVCDTRVSARGSGIEDGGDTRGKTAYAKACESCHGPEAKGGTAPALVPFTLELSELIAIVRQGIGVMPGLPRDRVSDDEISAIRDYLVSLKN